MRAIPEAMLADINHRLTWGTERHSCKNGVWDVETHYGIHRIEHKAREHVLTFTRIEIAKPLRRQGYFTELFQTILSDPRLMDQPVEWLYFENCPYRFATMLVDRLGFKSEPGLVTDAWRKVTPQMALL